MAFLFAFLGGGVPGVYLLLNFIGRKAGSKNGLILGFPNFLTPNLWGILFWKGGNGLHERRIQRGWAVIDSKFSDFAFELIGLGQFTIPVLSVFALFEKLLPSFLYPVGVKANKSQKERKTFFVNLRRPSLSLDSCEGFIPWFLSPPKFYSINLL